MSGDLPRAVLPIADRPVAPSTALDAKDPGATFPPIEPLRPPAGAPNVLFWDWIILILPEWVAMVSLHILRRERARQRMIALPAG